jgi:hypothetical protein
MKNTGKPYEELTELALSVPPLGKIHLAKACDQ